MIGINIVGTLGVPPHHNFFSKEFNFMALKKRMNKGFILEETVFALYCGSSCIFILLRELLVGVRLCIILK